MVTPEGRGGRKRTLVGTEGPHPIASENACREPGGRPLAQGTANFSPGCGVCWPWPGLAPRKPHGSLAGCEWRNAPSAELTWVLSSRFLLFLRNAQKTTSPLCFCSRPAFPGGSLFVAGCLGEGGALGPSRPGLSRYQQGEGGDRSSGRRRLPVQWVPGTSGVSRTTTKTKTKNLGDLVGLQLTQFGWLL